MSNPSHRCSNHRRKTLNLVLRTVQLSYVHKGCHCLLGCWWNTYSVQTTWKQTTLNQHDLGIHLAHNVITVLWSITGSNRSLKDWQHWDVLVQVACPSSGHNRVHYVVVGLRREFGTKIRSRVLSLPMDKTPLFAFWGDKTGTMDIVKVEIDEI